MTDEILISCPICGEKLKIKLDNSGNTTVFLMDEKPISQSELFKNHRIELGITEGGE